MLLERLFSSLDIDGDGVLTTSEFLSGLRLWVAQTLEQDRLARVSASAEKSHTPVDANMKRAAADDAADSVKQATAASEALTLRDAEAAGAAVDPERPDQ